MMMMARSIIAWCMNFPDARTRGDRDTDETGMRTRRRQEPGAAVAYHTGGRTRVRARMIPRWCVKIGLRRGERAREFARDDA